ncbi:MAG: hypothetical protein HQ492_08630 [Woeseiaceae bacterium]|nr:hypothetical protein [Woeseiaceae bacterium]
MNDTSFRHDLHVFGVVLFALFVPLISVIIMTSGEPSPWSKISGNAVALATFSAGFLAVMAAMIGAAALYIVSQARIASERDKVEEVKRATALALAAEIRVVKTWCSNIALSLANRSGSENIPLPATLHAASEAVWGQIYRSQHGEIGGLGLNLAPRVVQIYGKIENIRLILADDAHEWQPDQKDQETMDGWRSEDQIMYRQDLCRQRAHELYRLVHEADRVTDDLVAFCEGREPNEKPTNKEMNEYANRQMRAVQLQQSS